MRSLSKDAGRPDAGLAPRPLLIGSRKFWRHIGSSRLPLRVIEGRITRVFWSGMGDHPSFEVTATDGSKHDFSRYGDATRYSWGLRAMVESVDMPWKQGVPNPPSLVCRVVTRVLVERSSARSYARSPGPFGMMLLEQHQASRVAWGLRCFEHWLQIEGIRHDAIDELIEHLWSWLTITEDTFNDWHERPPRLVDSPDTELGLGLEPETDAALRAALRDATALAHDNLFVGFDHDRHMCSPRHWAIFSCRTA